MKQKYLHSIFIFSILFILTASVNAATVKGMVFDSKTHEGIPGAEVFVVGNLKYFAVANASGDYIITGMPAGKYKITAKCLSYQNATPKEVNLKDKQTVVTLDFAMKTTVKSINQVEVEGAKNRNSSAAARLDEKIAPNVINIISAKTIEELPDQNVADVMQRVSGVSMTKNSFGSNSNVIIRGMPPRYNSTLVDGVVMPSTSRSGRSVSLDMFGSELVGRVEVIKALTPDLEADAIGGTVNIQTKEAPDTAFFNVEAGTGYNQYYFNHNFLTFDNSTVAKKDFNELYGPNYLAQESQFPRQNLIVKTKTALPDLNLGVSGGQRFFNKKFGAMFALNVQRNSAANTYNYTNYIADLQTNKPAAQYHEPQVYSRDQKRYGGYVKLDYKFNPKNQISLFSSVFQMNELRVREFADHQTENAGQFIRPIETQTETDNSGIYSAALKGKHQLSKNLEVNWTLLYAAASSHSPDFATVTEAGLQNQPQYLNYTKPVVRDWQWDIDQNRSAYLNIIYKPTLFDHLFEFKAGGLYRSKYRKNYANEYYFEGYSDGSSKDYKNYPNPNILTVPLRNNQNAQEQEGNAYLNPGNYRAWEDIDAWYGMMNTTLGKLEVVTGVRFESTYMFIEHNQNNIQVPVAKATKQYYNFFPSLHLTYKLTDKQNLRFSVYRAINRPNYTEIIPAYDPRAGAQSGNPKLKPAYGNCVDMRYEIYPREGEVFTAGIFYKKISNAIEDLVSPANENRTFRNIPNSTNYGLELVASKNLGNFSFSGNYTYTHSSVSNVWHNFVYKNNVYDTVVAVYGTRPLVGQSPNLLNLSVSYHNPIWNFKSSISYTMQGRYLVYTNDHLHFDEYQATYHNLGLSLEQKIGKDLFVDLKISNLLNSPLTGYMPYENNTLIEKKYNYQTYYIGLKFSL